ncbi:MAG: NAD(P)/FAD-dependent oxidoreductase [Actinomycetota bacterium]|nr:NAD(P)/FAD-dependent oxidoreductase [Actinomycetota bacterium]
MTRAVVVGSGPNGLAAAITLAQAGVKVEVREAEAEIGGGLRTSEVTLPGFLHDLCATVQPLAVGSPFFRELDLPVEWVHPGAPAAHPLDDGTAVMLERDLGATADGLGRDGAAYGGLVGPLVNAWDELSSVLLGRLPPSPRRTLRAVSSAGLPPVARAARAALADARSFTESTFETERARAWFAGHCAHSMLPLEVRPSAGFGLALAVLGHAVGWPFARGGAARLADALAARLRELGGSIATSSLVDELPEADAVLADVVPGELLRIAGDRLPERYARSLRSYRHGPGVFKVDWALDGPIPWSAEDCRRAGTIHLGGTLDEISASEAAAWSGRPAERPFVLLVQQTVFDETRAPAGQHSAWAYCHVPNGSTVDMTERIEAQVERFAPGFRDLVLERHTMSPAAFEAHNRNLVGGDINGGAMTLGQVFFRPTHKRVPYRTPLDGVYLCSASTPPGGGVHGMCGYWAAQVALRDLGRDFLPL